MDTGRKHPRGHSAPASVTYSYSSGVPVKGNHLFRTRPLAGSASHAACFFRVDSACFIPGQASRRAGLRAGSAAGAANKPKAQQARRLLLLHPKQRPLPFHGPDVPLIQTGHAAGHTAGTLMGIKDQVHAAPPFSTRQRMHRYPGKPEYGSRWSQESRLLASASRYP